MPSEMCRPPQGGRWLKSPGSPEAPESPGRPPQGGRWLKLSVHTWNLSELCRPPQGGRWLKYRNRVGKESKPIVAPRKGGVG